MIIVRSVLFGAKPNAKSYSKSLVQGSPITSLPTQRKRIFFDCTLPASVGSLLNITIAGLFSGRRTTCPAYCNLPSFIRLAMSAFLYNWYNSSMRLRHSLFITMRPLIRKSVLFLSTMCTELVLSVSVSWETIACYANLCYQHQ